MFALVEGNMVRVCADVGSNTDQCTPCTRTAAPVLGGFNDYQCNNVEGKMVYLANNAVGQANYLILCEVQIEGSPA